jgi:hypothetical protein
MRLGESFWDEPEVPMGHTSLFAAQQWLTNRIGPARSALYEVGPSFRSTTLNLARCFGTLPLDEMPLSGRMNVIGAIGWVAFTERSGVSDPGNVVESKRIGDPAL